MTGSLAWLAAGRRRGGVAIGGALVAVQGVLHLLFSALGEPHGTASPSAPGPAQAAHGHAPMPPMPGMDAMPGMAAMDGMDGMGGMPGMDSMGSMAGHGGLGMIAAHVLAALFCAVWLAWGEAAVFRLARTLGALAAVAAAPLRRALGLVRAHRPRTPARPARPRTPEPPRTLRGAVRVHDAVKRGPPGPSHTRATAPGRPACA
ncbi:hypothetical protein OHS33_10340 [Streptomyces sp. NBC_00536]|uniref:hypothetical protein n=1 Tax=Streptomyces sp. NBC_00536 TaxID=2975769 RepID=UPI002E81ED06|nr:hypothetical protein [Streptomyces sp. NBC_00536]WUC78704.1 hypothetical protein OHS33_10340 [Streptomyces sp. NBC_00536]